MRGSAQAPPRGKVRRLEPTATLSEHCPAVSPAFPWIVVDAYPEVSNRLRMSLRLSAVSLQSAERFPEVFRIKTPWRSRNSPRTT